MKKVLVLVVALMLTMACAMMVACGDSSVEGTYYFSSITIGETTYEVGDEMYGQELTKDYMIVKVEKDGVLKVTEMGEEEIEGTWELVEGNTYSFTINGVPQEATVKGGEITFESEEHGVTYIVILKK